MKKTTKKAGANKVNSKAQTLLQQARALDPNPNVSRMGWDTKPIEECLDLAIAYCRNEVGAAAFAKVITGHTEATNTYYLVGKIFERALRQGLLRRVHKRNTGSVGG